MNNSLFISMFVGSDEERLVGLRVPPVDWGSIAHGGLQRDFPKEERQVRFEGLRFEPSIKVGLGLL